MFFKLLLRVFFVVVFITDIQTQTLREKIKQSNEHGLKLFDFHVFLSREFPT